MKFFHTNHERRTTNDERGAALLLTFIVMVTLISVVGAYLGFVQYSTRSTGAQIESSQAFYLADAGLNMAIWYLDNTAPDSSTDGSWRTTAYPAAPGSNPTDPQQETLGSGTFTIWAEDSGSDVKIYARGTVGQLSRVIEETVAVTYSGIDKGIHADGATLDFEGTSGVINGDVSCHVAVQNYENLTITGTVTEGLAKINPSLDFDTYKTIAQGAGQYYTTALTFENDTYTGVYYTTLGVTIGDNAIINGSIIAQGAINFANSADNVQITPSNNYPALATQGSLNSSDIGPPATRVGLQNSSINGLIFVINNVTFNYMQNTTFTGTILANNNIQMKDGSDFTLTYDEDVFSPLPAGFSVGAVDITELNDWNEI